jgi:porin
MKHLFTFVILIIFLITNLSAQSNTDSDQEIISANKLIDLEGLKASTGIGMSFGYKGEVFSNFAGGLNKKSVYLDNFDLIFDFDLNHILNWKGASLNAYILGNHGGDPSEYAGAAQGISNIASFQTWKLYQFWFQQNFLEDDLSILVGLFDLNSEFDTRETSGIFINPSHGIGPDFSMTGKNGPSIFPTTSLALRTSYNISSYLNIKAAVFDGVPGDPDKPGGTHILFKQSDGLLLAGELTFHSENDELDKNYYKVSLGAWYYTGDFEKFNAFNNDVNPVCQNGNSGMYLSAEKFLLSENSSNDEGISAFVRIGTADKTINEVQHYIGAGLHYKGIIPGRENDIAGIALGSIINSDNYLQSMLSNNNIISKHEHIIELTYIIDINNWLIIQPDFQYVINPANCYYNKSSFLYGTRISLEI